MVSNNQHEEIGLIGYILGFTLFIFLIIAGYISYKSIDWKVLQKMEAQQLIVPPIATQSALPTVTTAPSINK